MLASPQARQGTRGARGARTNLFAHLPVAALPRTPGFPSSLHTLSKGRSATRQVGPCISPQWALAPAPPPAHLSIA